MLVDRRFSVKILNIYKKDFGKCIYVIPCFIRDLRQFIGIHKI
jgi:hypothetical protein